MSSRKHEKSKFGAILFDSVYEGLNSIGASIPSVILPHLERNGSIGPGSIINDPKAFDEGLKRIFGFAAEVIEKKILEILYAKLRIHQEVKGNFNFTQEIVDVYNVLSTAKSHLLLLGTVDA
jgi:hypothetical protein